MRSFSFLSLATFCLLAANSLATAGMVPTGVSVTSEAGPGGGANVVDTSVAFDAPTLATTGSASASLTISSPVYDPISKSITYSGVASSSGDVSDHSLNTLVMDFVAECDYTYTFTATAVAVDSGQISPQVSLNLFVITNTNGSVKSDFGQPDQKPNLGITDTISAGETPTFGFFNRNQDDAPLIGGTDGDGFEYNYAFELVFSNPSADCACSVPEPSSFLFMGLIGMFGYGWKRFAGNKVSEDS